MLAMEPCLLRILNELEQLLSSSKQLRLQGSKCLRFCWTLSLPKLLQRSVITPPCQCAEYIAPVMHACQE